MERENPTIFLSYRRDDRPATCEQLRDVLMRRFGKGIRFFKDTDDIPLGQDYRQVISQAAGEAAVVLVLIGPDWLAQGDLKHWRDNSDDAVRFELEVAAAHGVMFIPVLLDGATFPAPSDLPANLTHILNQNGINLGSPPFDPVALAKLIRVLDEKFLPAKDTLVLRKFNDVEVYLPRVQPVAAGSSMMGSDGLENEHPPHLVTIPYFSLATFAVTVQEYQYFVQSTGHAAPPDRDISWGHQRNAQLCPVVNVTWNDACAYAAWLAQVTGMAWRLPTEAEWEKAARWDAAVSVAREYPWGDTFKSNRCNTSESGSKSPSPIGHFANDASPFQIREMAGNVWEWTSSLNKPYPFNTADGREDISSTGNRVHRGGAWNHSADFARCARRMSHNPTFCDRSIGFRLALG